MEIDVSERPVLSVELLLYEKGRKRKPNSVLLTNCLQAFWIQPIKVTR